jgi:two-component system cell cycle response regulator
VARILIIEDNRADLDLMTSLLAGRGHVALAAHDGASAIELARRVRPGLVLCGLPADDGVVVVAALRADAGFARLPLVALPAPGAARERERLLAAGFNGYIVTPIEPPSFAAEVEAFLPAAPALLLVDDDRFMLDLLADVLAPEGYRLLRAGSGGEALMLLASEAVQLVVCDQCMPGMSGTELCARVRKLQPHAFRIILSGQSDAGPIAAALADGTVDRYLAKPWHGEQLLAGIRDALRQQGGRDDA